MVKPVTDLIRIDTTLAVPVYKQIVQSICRNIENGVLVKNDVLPSVNKISEEFTLARGSVFTAYNELRASGLIDSIPGKGYFISGTQTKQDKRIFLLFSTFNPYKETLFNSLRHNLPKTWTLDIYFHNHNINTFKSLLKNQAGYYNLFIIMPEINAETTAILSTLDPKKVFLLDVGYNEYKKEYPGVYQNFEKDIYNILVSNSKAISKYKQVTLVVKEGVGAKHLAAGLKKFSKKAGINITVNHDFKSAEAKKGEAYIITDDTDLVELVKLSKAKNWQPGKDIGIICYNENTLKSVIGEGITTISTDFETMGKTMAGLLINGKRDVVENPFIIIDRNSL